MNNTKMTRRALLTSVVAMFVCITMLIGTTFAWFTDTASTAVNKIQAGKLDVALEMKNADGEWESAEGKTLSFKKAAGHESEEVLWEPGCTYELPELRIVNKGNLALKYKIAVTGIQGSAKLNEAIDWAMSVDGTPAENLNSVVDKAIEPNDNSGIITIKGHMKEDAGNQYQGLSIDGIGITVVATQVASEFDSFDDQYDVDAPYPVIATTTLINTAGETVVQDKDNNIKLTAPANSLGDGTTMLSLTVEETAAPSTITVGDMQAEQTFEVSLKDQNGTKVTAQGDTLFTVDMYVGPNRENLKLYHSGSEMVNDGSTLSDTAEHYIYNSVTGYVTMKVNSFSPFTVVYDNLVSVTTLDDLASYDSNIQDYANKTSGTYKFQNDLEVSKRVMFAKDVVIDLNGHTLKINTTRWGNYPGTSPEITIKNGRVEVVKDGGYFWHVRSDEVVINLENVQIDTTKGYAAFGTDTYNEVQKLTINADETTNIIGDFLFAKHSFAGNAETPSLTNIVVNGVHASAGTSKHSVVLNATNSNVKINAEFNDCVIDCQAVTPIYCNGHTNNGTVSLAMNDCKLIAHNSGISNAIFTNNINCTVTLNNCIDKAGNSLTY